MAHGKYPVIIVSYCWRMECPLLQKPPPGGTNSIFLPFSMFSYLRDTNTGCFPFKLVSYKVEIPSINFKFFYYLSPSKMSFSKCVNQTQLVKRMNQSTLGALLCQLISSVIFYVTFNKDELCFSNSGTFSLSFQKIEQRRKGS